MSDCEHEPIVSACGDCCAERRMVNGKRETCRQSERRRASTAALLLARVVAAMATSDHEVTLVHREIARALR